MDQFAAFLALRAPAVPLTCSGGRNGSGYSSLVTTDCQDNVAFAYQDIHSQNGALDNNHCGSPRPGPIRSTRAAGAPVFASVGRPTVMITVGGGGGLAQGRGGGGCLLTGNSAGCVLFMGNDKHAGCSFFKA